ncbi:MAG: hypothetical protein GX372_03310 [Ignavibacteria bacterium]|jgi:hypothetical protein|nr:hypothetical protein [Ignavibacteria bacterium]
MKKQLILLFMLMLLFSLTSCFEDDNIVNSSVYNDDIEYYHYDQHGKEIHYTKCKHRIVIYVNSEEKVNEVLDAIKGQVTVDCTLSKIIWASIDSTRTDIVKNIKSIKNVESVHYMVITKGGFFQVASNSINIIFKENIDVYKFLEKAGISNLVAKVEKARFTDEPIYTVYFITTNLDFYKLSRDLYKAGSCVYVGPNFCMELIPYNF